MAKPQGGLTKWFKEDWRDVKTGKKCGRSGKEKGSRPYPACRPAKVAGRISKKEAAKKTGGISQVTYPILKLGYVENIPRTLTVIRESFSTQW
jgi:hypothetical protein